MSKRPSLFRTASSRRLYGQTEAVPATPLASGEVDMRAEFDLLIYGDTWNIPHGRWFILRHLRRSTNGRPIDCSCLNKLTGDPDFDCAYCLGEGYLWDESWSLGYTSYIGADGGLGNRAKWMPSGEVKTEQKAFYLRYDVPLKYGDKIVEVKLDTEGEIIQPFVRESIYKPQTIHQNRSDNGRIEFITVYCREADAIRLDAL